jgi:preprotein translocase SecE subunit
MSLITYLKDTQGELKHVSWPTRGQAIAFTVVVVLISIFVSVYLGLFDYVLKFLLSKVFDKFVI